MAPPGVRFVMGVSIQAGAGAARAPQGTHHASRAREQLVRVLGRRVYVDFSPDSHRSPRDHRRLAELHGPANAGGTAVAVPAAPPRLRPTRDEAYRVAVDRPSSGSSS